MLENVLIDYFDLPLYWNDEEEKDNWNESYAKLIELIYRLEELGVLSSRKIVECLDEINDREE